MSDGVLDPHGPDHVKVLWKQRDVLGITDNAPGTRGELADQQSKGCGLACAIGAEEEGETGGDGKVYGDENQSFAKAETYSIQCGDTLMTGIRRRLAP